MKFDCDSRRDRREAKRKARKAALREWHPYFAWFPVRLAHGDCRFLETVERRFVTFSSAWDYGFYRIEYRERVR